MVFKYAFGYGCKNLIKEDEKLYRQIKLRRIDLTDCKLYEPKQCKVILDDVFLTHSLILVSLLP